MARGKHKHYSTLGEQASSSELWGPSTSRFTNWTRSWLKYNWHSFLITKSVWRQTSMNHVGVDFKFQRVFAFVLLVLPSMIRSKGRKTGENKTGKKIFFLNDYAILIWIFIIKKKLYWIKNDADIYCKMIVEFVPSLLKKKTILKRYYRKKFFHESIVSIFFLQICKLEKYILSEFYTTNVIRTISFFLGFLS